MWTPALATKNPPAPLLAALVKHHNAFLNHFLQFHDQNPSIFSGLSSAEPLTGPITGTDGTEHRFNTTFGQVLQPF